jgi:hypothetical protein
LIGSFIAQVPLFRQTTPMRDRSRRLARYFVESFDVYNAEVVERATEKARKILLAGTEAHAVPNSGSDKHIDEEKEQEQVGVIVIDSDEDVRNEDEWGKPRGASARARWGFTGGHCAMKIRNAQRTADGRPFVQSFDMTTLAFSPFLRFAMMIPL